MPQPSSQIPDFSVIVISYNTREMTLACLASVYAQTTGDFEVVVVDNASSDGSAEAIRAQFPQVQLIAESVNHGFAAAHHVAVPHCRAPWLLLLNPDTVVLDGALDRLMAFRRARPGAGIWGGRTVFADGSLNPASCWRRQTLWSLFCRASGLAVVFSGSKLFNPEAYPRWARDSEREVDIVTGCLFLIARETWDRLGGFDPVFVMYGEEADLCLRAQRIGLRPAITPEAVIIHHGGASEAVWTNKLVRILRAKAELANRHLAPGTRRLGRVLNAARPASRLLVLSVLAALTRQTRFHDAASTWRTVWSRRAEWYNGFRPGA